MLNQASRDADCRGFSEIQRGADLSRATGRAAGAHEPGFARLPYFKIVAFTSTVTVLSVRGSDEVEIVSGFPFSSTTLTTPR